MKLQIKWTSRGERSFESIYEYIKLRFGESTAKKFSKQSFDALNLLCVYPNMGTAEDVERKIFGFVLSEQTTLFYRKNESQLILLNFYNNKGNPKLRSEYYKE